MRCRTFASIFIAAILFTIIFLPHFIKPILGLVNGREILPLLKSVWGVDIKKYYLINVTSLSVSTDYVFTSGSSLNQNLLIVSVRKSCPIEVAVLCKGKLYLRDTGVLKDIKTPQDICESVLIFIERFEKFLGSKSEFLNSLSKHMPEICEKLDGIKAQEVKMNFDDISISIVMTDPEGSAKFSGTVSILASPPYPHAPVFFVLRLPLRISDVGKTKLFYVAYRGEPKIADIPFNITEEEAVEIARQVILGDKKVIEIAKANGVNLSDILELEKIEVRFIPGRFVLEQWNLIKRIIKHSSSDMRYPYENVQFNRTIANDTLYPIIYVWFNLTKPLKANPKLSPFLFGFYVAIWPDTGEIYSYNWKFIYGGSNSGNSPEQATTEVRITNSWYFSSIAVSTFLAFILLKRRFVLKNLK
ncbi:MAG: hypothetical protein J7J99_08805 [Thermoprotei archaeon]|nr:hypothetical protein [Thermoprotei archaeon]